MTVADTIRDERLALVSRLRDLPESDWSRPSLCEGWTVHHVLAHLATPFTVGAAGMGVEILRRRSVSRAMDAAAKRIAGQHSPAELLATLESNAASTFRPPGLPLAAPLTDAVAHSADIRWALGDGTADWGDPARLRPVLNFLTGPRARAGFVPPARLRGVALVADDQDWRQGDGAEVRGRSLALVMAVLGRRAAASSVTGDGVALLQR